MKKDWKPHPEWVRLVENETEAEFEIHFNALEQEIAACLEQGKSQRLKYLVGLKKVLEEIHESRTSN